MGSCSHALLSHKVNKWHMHLKTSKCGQALFKHAATDSFVTVITFTPSEKIIATHQLYTEIKFVTKDIFLVLPPFIFFAKLESTKLLYTKRNR